MARVSYTPAGHPIDRPHLGGLGGDDQVRHSCGGMIWVVRIGQKSTALWCDKCGYLPGTE
jgi:hypothetical protein